MCSPARPLQSMADHHQLQSHRASLHRYSRMGEGQANTVRYNLSGLPRTAQEVRSLEEGPPETALRGDRSTARQCSLDIVFVPRGMPRSPPPILAGAPHRLERLLAGCVSPTLRPRTPKSRPTWLLAQTAASRIANRLSASHTKQAARGESPVVFGSQILDQNPRPRG